MKTIAVINMKGGVGKTTSSLNIATGLANKGYRVLLVDIDPQANSTDILLNIKNEEIFVDAEVLEAINRMDQNALETSLDRLTSYEYNEVFIDQMLVDADCTTTYKTIIDNLDIIPSRLELANVERDIRNGHVAMHNRLKKIIKKVESNYDYVIIDCPPIINILTVNVLNTSDEIIVPIKVDRGAEKGLIMTIKELIAISVSYDLDLLVRPMFTMVNRTTTDRDRIQYMRQFENNVVKPIGPQVRQQPKPVGEASYDNTVVINDPKANVGKDYQDVVDYLVNEWKEVSVA